MARSLRKLVPALLATAARGASASSCSVQATLVPAFKILGEQLSSSFRSSLHTSCGVQADITDASKAGPVKLYEPERKFRPLADKELWHEAWMYEDKFGTEDDPIVVPSLEKERIIGVTDPEDDNLVVWGILRAGEPARQFIEGGEYYVLLQVPYVAKVGDVIELLEGGGAKSISK